MRLRVVRLRVVSIVGLCAVSGACGGAAERTPLPDPADPTRGPGGEASESTPCAELPSGAVARFGPGCGFAVIEAGSNWSLRSGEAAPTPGRELPRPAPCLTADCELAGQVDAETGTIVVLAALRSGLHEGAQMVWLIAPGEEARPLWLEPSVLGDGTPQGPAYELWPHRCTSDLALVPRARFDDGAEGVAAPETRAAAGWITRSKGADSEDAPPEGCVPMSLEVSW